MTRTVAAPVDDSLVINVGPGSGDWTYSVTVVHDGEEVTAYGSNFEPWGRAGVTMLGNILVTRVDDYESKEQVAALLEEAFTDCADALESLDTA